MRYSIPKAYLVLLIFIFWIVFFVKPVPAFETYAPNDTLSDQGIDDVEWVDAGSLDVSWKTTSMDSGDVPINVEVINNTGEYENVPYVLKVNDIDLEQKMARVSLAKVENGAQSVQDVLLLNETNNTEENTTGENTSEGNTNEGIDDWCQIDHELKVQLTGITLDSQQIPHVQLKYYKRGNPKLDITIESEANSNNSEPVSNTAYIPGKERMVKVTVKNTGEAWIENIKLDVNLTDFIMVSSRENLSESHIQTSGDHLSAELGWLAKNEDRSMNFTIRSPSWSDVNSRLKLSPVNITANATGDDILGYEHKGGNNISLIPPDPDIEVSQLGYPYTYSLEKIRASHAQSGSNSTDSTSSSTSNEIDMSAWYIKGSEVHDLRGYFAIKQTVHNLQGYYLNNLSYVFTPVPEGLIIGKVREDENTDISSGSSSESFWSMNSIEILQDTSSNPFNGSLPKTLSGMKSKNENYILIPTQPGIYQLGSFSVSTVYEGHTLTKTSEATSFTVHGPKIVVNKSITASGGGKVDVAITVKNYGDRVAAANLTERVPADVRMVQDSINISHNGKPENDSIPLRNWELKTQKDKNSTSILMNFPLRPSEYYDLKYSIQPENLSSTDLPPAKVNFVDLNAYKGTVLSSFFKSGAEVKQAWDFYENRWKVTSDHWNASTGEWEDNWDPIANRWTNETISVSNNTSVNDTEMENNSATTLEPPKEKSTLDKIMDFIFGLLPWGNKSSEQSNISAQPAHNNSGNESALDNLRNFVRGLIPGGKQNNETSPAQNPSNNQSSGSD